MGEPPTELVCRLIGVLPRLVLATFLLSSQTQTELQHKPPSASTLSAHGIMEAITNRPSVDSFVALSEYQSATPASFHVGPAVLHFSSRATVIVSKEHLQEHSALRALSSESNDDDAADVAITDAEIFVTSKLVPHTTLLTNFC
jgi:hypothetical protein